MGRRGSAPRGRAAEATINVSMAEVLDGMRHAWQSRGEIMGGVLRGGRRPDIFITRAGMSPVIIETEFTPANTLEADVMARIGAETTTGQSVGGVIGVRVPERFRRLDGESIRDEFRASNDLEYAVWSTRRFPENGWIVGGLADIARVVDELAVPYANVGDCVSYMSNAIDGIANIIGGGAENAKRNCTSVIPKRKRTDVEDGRAHLVQRVCVS